MRGKWDPGAQVFTTYGFLKPWHTQYSYPVRIYKYRYRSGAWKSYGYVLAKAGDARPLGNKNLAVHTSAEDWPWHGTALAVHLIRMSRSR